MTRLALFAALIALPVQAQDVTATYPPDSVVVIHLQNNPTFGDDGDGVYTFDTPRGPVTVQHASTPNGPGGCCPDTLEVVDRPDGTVALPPLIEVEEKRSGRIVIREWAGM